MTEIRINRNPYDDKHPRIHGIRQAYGRAYPSKWHVPTMGEDGE